MYYFLCFAVVIVHRGALADKHFESGWCRDHGDLVQSIRDPNNRDGLHSSWLGGRAVLASLQVWAQVNMRYPFVTVDNFQCALLRCRRYTCLSDQRIHVTIANRFHVEVLDVRTDLQFYLNFSLFRLLTILWVPCEPISLPTKPNSVTIDIGFSYLYYKSPNYDNPNRTYSSSGSIKLLENCQQTPMRSSLRLRPRKAGLCLKSRKVDQYSASERSTRSRDSYAFMRHGFSTSKLLSERD